MDLSWAFIISLPLVLSPGFFALIAFRLVIPHAKSRHSSDYIYLMPFIIFTLLLNFELILEFANTNKFYLDNSIGKQILTSLGEASYWFTPTLWISSACIFIKDFLLNLPQSFCNWPILKTAEYSLFTLVWDIQLRAFLASLAFGLIIRSMYKIDDYYESYSYLHLDKKGFVHWLIRVVGKFILRYKISKEISERKKQPNQRGYFSKLVENINLVLSNEWVNSLSYNENIEILMVDIRTKDDHLYSGVFTNILAGKSSELESISMYNVLCYYPDKKENIEKDKKETAENDHKNKNNFYASTRKWRLIKNRGELFILSDEILTMNFWYMRKGIKLKEVVYHGEDYIFEKIKWNILLVYSYPHIIDSYEIKLYYKDIKEKQDFVEKFSKWFNENNFEKMSKIKMLPVKITEKK